MPQGREPERGREPGWSGVVALSRWRALLARARSPAKRVEALLAEADAAAVVPRLAAQDVYWLVRGVGLGDAAPLLRLASPAQVRACLDLDGWERDHLSDARTLAWLRALVELEPARLAAAVRELDAELVALLVARHFRVHDRTLGEAPPADTTNVLLETSDGFFLLEVLGADAEAARVLERFVDHLYRADAALARALLMEAKWSTPMELEELAFRWRSGRMADEGFVPYHEAVDVYRYLDPRTVTVGEGREPLVASAEPPVLPVLFAEPLAEETFLARALARIEDPALLDDLTRGLVTLLNRVLTADRLDAGDAEAVRAATARARDTLSLGLEYLSEGRLERAVEALATVALGRLFRVGFSLGLELRRLARQLRARGVDDVDLEPLLGPRPALPGALDEPPRAGARPLRTLADVRRVAAWLGRLGGRLEGGSPG